MLMTNATVTFHIIRNGKDYFYKSVDEVFIFDSGDMAVKYPAGLKWKYGMYWGDDFVIPFTPAGKTPQTTTPQNGDFIQWSLFANLGDIPLEDIHLNFGFDDSQKIWRAFFMAVGGGQ